MLQRARARRPAGTDLVGPDHHLRHAWRAQSRARRDVHARRLCRLGRVQLHRILHQRFDKGVNEFLNQYSEQELVFLVRMMQDLLHASWVKPGAEIKTEII